MKTVFPFLLLMIGMEGLQAFSISSVPEPAVVAVGFLGLAGLLLSRKEALVSRRARYVPG